MRSHDELEALAEGYVLLALEPEEQEAFEAHLATCDRCTQRVAELQAVTGALALLAEEKDSPPQLRDRILAAARAEGSGISPAITRQARMVWWRVFTRPVAVAAAMGLLLLAVAGLAFWVFQLQDRLDTRETRLEATELRLSRGYQAINIMAQADQRWSFEGTEVAAGANGILAYSSQQSAACLVAWGLPAAESKGYHAWALKDGAYSKVGRMWKMDDALWLIVPGQVDQLDAVIITLEEVRTPKEPTGPVVARVPLSRK